MSVLNTNSNPISDGTILTCKIASRYYVEPFTKLMTYLFLFIYLFVHVHTVLILQFAPTCRCMYKLKQFAFIMT